MSRPLYRLSFALTETVLLPAMVVGSAVFLPSWRQHLMAKTELKFAKITVK
jgi:hypothetical protein